MMKFSRMPLRTVKRSSLLLCRARRLSVAPDRHTGVTAIQGFPNHDPLPVQRRCGMTQHEKSCLLCIRTDGPRHDRHGLAQIGQLFRYCCR